MRRVRGPGTASLLTRLLLAFGAALVVAVGAYKLVRFVTEPRVPALHLENVRDPAILSAVKQAVEQVRAQPRVGVAWGRLGAILFVHDLAGDAAVVLEQAERLDPRQPRWPYLRALSVERQNPDAAGPLLARAAELTADALPAPRCRYAEFLLTRGKTSEAAKNFQEVLDHFPGEPRALLGLGRVSLQDGKVAEAAGYLERAANAAPQWRETLVLLAAARQRLGDAQKADEASAAATVLEGGYEPPDPFVAETQQLRVGEEADLKTAQQMLDEHRYEALITFMRPRVERYADDPRAWRLLGAGYLRTSRFEEAEKAFRRAVAIAPRLVDALNDLGTALYHEGLIPEGEETFRKALRLNPADSAANFGLGLSLVAGQSWRAAAEAFRAAVRARPNWANAYMGLGDALTRNGQPELALEPLREALKIEPGNAVAEALLARAQAQTSK